MRQNQTGIQQNQQQKKMNQRISPRNTYRCRATHICTYRNPPKTKQNNKTKTETMISAKDL